MKPAVPYVSCLAVLTAGALLAGCTEQDMARQLPFVETDQSHVTWYRDVLPLARKHCQGCHTADGIAPFSMLTYEKSAEYAEHIASQVGSGIMPPWLPAAGCSKFVGDRSMTQAEVETFKAWYLDGARAGDPADAPAGGPPPVDHLSSVDATLKASTLYTPVGDPKDPAKQDDYHCVVLDPKLDADRYVVGFEVQPGVRKEVHHVLLYPASAMDLQARTADELAHGWTCFGGPGTKGSSVLGGWVPGMPPIQFPESTGVRLPKGDFIVMQVHYNLANGDPEPDQTTILLDYADSPVAKPAQIFPLVKYDFVIPPKTPSYTASYTLTVPRDARLWGLIPHMHTLGRSISLETEHQCLIDIPNWDFHWQQMYFFNTPGGIALSQGDTATLSCTWSNPRNTEVRWGESTSDEMCLSYVFVTE